MKSAQFGLKWTFLVLACGWIAFHGCKPDTGGGDGDGDADGDVDCDPGTIYCNENSERTCNSDGDGYRDERDCGGAAPVCCFSIGCAACCPGSRQCAGNDIQECNPDGTGWSTVDTCPDSCVGGFCGSACGQAESSNSYEGCEYRAATLMNSGLSTDFRPAVVISNRNAEPATVTVTRGGSHVAEATVSPRSTQTIQLDWVMELKQQILVAGDVEESTNVDNGSYRIVSDLPVTVYQFNPLEYNLDHDCIEGDQDPFDGQCYSYSNDASLLLPVHVLTEHYIVMARPNLGINYHIRDPFFGDEDLYSFSPSMMAVVNPHDNDITVNITFSAATQPGPGMRAYSAGESGSFTIRPGGVLQFATFMPESCSPDWSEPEEVDWDGMGAMVRYGYCSQSQYDFTGTEVEASQPVAVFGGHNCAFVPFNRWACDHLEEQLFPYETWGKQFVVSQSSRENGEPDIFRILSGANSNRVTFSPGSIHGDVTLNRGEYVEFEAHGAFMIDAAEPIMVGQFIVGQNYNSATATTTTPGDPAFSLAVPIEQYRNSYNFLAPDTYERSYVNVTVSSGSTSSVQLDGGSLDAGWERVGDSGYSTLRHEITPGSHEISAGTGVTFGITVYGYGQFTSYMYPGGLDLNEIAIW